MAASLPMPDVAGVARAPAPASLRIVLAIFTLFTVGRFGDVVPFLYVIPIGKICAALSLVLTITSMPRWQLRAATAHTTMKAVGLIGILAVISIPTSVWPGNSFAFLRAGLLPVLVFFFVTAVGLVDRRTLRTVVTVLVLGVGISAAKVLVKPQFLEAGRVLTGSLDPNDTAALLVLTMPLALVLAADRAIWRKALFGGLALVMVAALVKTGSRGGVLGLLAVGACTVWFAPPRRRMLFGAAVVAGGFVFAASADQAMRERFLGTFSREENYNFTAREGRLEIWKRGVGLIVSNPIVGVGIDGYEVADGTKTGKAALGGPTRYTSAHNTLLEIGAELGVFGLGAFLTAFWAAGVGAVRVRRQAIAARATQGEAAEREATLAAGVVTSFFGVSVAAFFLSFAWMAITYFLLALCIGLYAGRMRGAPRARAAAVPVPDPGAMGWPMRRRGFRGGLHTAPLRYGGSPLAGPEAYGQLRD